MKSGVSGSFSAALRLQLGTGMGSAPFFYFNFYSINLDRGVPTTFPDLFFLAVHGVSAKNGERGLDKIFCVALIRPLKKGETMVHACDVQPLKGRPIVKDLRHR